MLEKPIMFDLNEEICNALQYLHYIVSSYSEILKDILSNKRGINANKELLDYYNEQYIKYNVELKTLQEELVHDFYDVPAGSFAIYYIDFINQQLVITSIENTMQSKAENTNEI